MGNGVCLFGNIFLLYREKRSSPWPLVIYNLLDFNLALGRLIPKDLLTLELVRPGLKAKGSFQ